jgi:hypothetical protein
LHFPPLGVEQQELIGVKPAAQEAYVVRELCFVVGHVVEKVSALCDHVLEGLCSAERSHDLLISDGVASGVDQLVEVVDHATVACVTFLRRRDNLCAARLATGTGWEDALAPTRHEREQRFWLSAGCT